MNSRKIKIWTQYPKHKSKAGIYKCRVCGQELSGKRTSFCSHMCSNFLNFRGTWQTLRAFIFQKYGGICAKCGKSVGKRNYHIDHIIPVSKGGPLTEPENLQLMCPNCNLSKHDKLDEDELRRLIAILKHILRDLKKLQKLAKTLLKEI